MPIKFAAAMTAFAIAGTVEAHSGGLNAEGCHTNKSTGEYHCHRGQAANLSGKPTQQAAPSSVRPQQPAQTAGGSKCYVGPRGGTYTITPSGRKNYSGC